MAKDKFPYMIFSPAKVNLHLKILDRRADGYHNIFSLFQCVSMSDRIWICSLTEPSDLVDGVDATPGSNTLIKVLNEFRSYTGLDFFAHIRVEKNIPQGAGLGGGSSNAASLLKALNEIFSTQLGVDDLIEIGAKVGSDVPFFLKSPAAIVSGRGEVLKPIRARDDFFIVLVEPGFCVNTSDAYAWLDAYAEGNPGFFDMQDPNIEEQYLFFEPEKWDFYNSFLPVLLERFPILLDLERLLRTYGAVYTNVSGSGSTFFGVFNYESDAHNACVSLKKKGFSAHCVRPLSFFPG
ncbi:4-(cytidine 5'-diphospho)-2-C-methyl-D-erythritol kinase [Spirochaetia bacterium 38H-sp]|uniref:4-diphosphocytidyl-2-C-methyl-D-erythritol kinase n=1 Tax=Rarispira pelagica TaxID=3141764 RepID=A0ABU9UEM8_9SPIR